MQELFVCLGKWLIVEACGFVFKMFELFELTVTDRTLELFELI